MAVSREHVQRFRKGSQHVPSQGPQARQRSSGSLRCRSGAARPREDGRRSGQTGYAIEKINKHGIVDSGDALDKGIGCLTAERYKWLADELVRVGLLKQETDYTKAFDTRFS